MLGILIIMELKDWALVVKGNIISAFDIPLEVTMSFAKRIKLSRLENINY
jgi:hypothetical protein